MFECWIKARHRSGLNTVDKRITDNFCSGMMSSHCMCGIDTTIMNNNVLHFLKYGVQMDRSFFFNCYAFKDLIGNN